MPAKTSYHLVETISLPHRVSNSGRIKSLAELASFPWMTTTKKMKMRLQRSRTISTGRATRLGSWMVSLSESKTAWNKMKKGSWSRRKMMTSRWVFLTKSKKMRTSKTRFPKSTKKRAKKTSRRMRLKSKSKGTCHRNMAKKRCKIRTKRSRTCLMPMKATRTEVRREMKTRIAMMMMMRMMCSKVPCGRCRI